MSTPVSIVFECFLCNSLPPPSLGVLPVLFGFTFYTNNIGSDTIDLIDTKNGLFDVNIGNVQQVWVNLIHPFKFVCGTHTRTHVYPILFIRKKTLKL